MQILTQFSFDSFADYTSFCEHMVKFKSSAAPAKPVLEKESIQPKVAAKTETVKDEAPKAAKAEAKAEAKIEPKAEAKTEKKPEAEAQAKLATEPTYENMKKAVLAVSVKTQSKAKAFEILKKYGHAKVTPEMDDTHFAEIIADCQEALDAAE